MTEPQQPSYRIRAGDNREYGPVDFATLERWLREARVRPTMPVWSSADNMWRPARERQELSAVFAALCDPNAPPVVGPPVNAMAVWSFVLCQFGLCCTLPAIPAIICGFISLSQIRQRGERGRALAVSGIILGVCGLAMGALLVVYMVVLARLGPEGQQQLLQEMLRQ
ncbi:MAG: DUF4190 domain-containing protein, partial [Verrucomicrobia bacterium]|nr:DUF4190 domain-containing protein [Verrucomicrobiota bacterium]